MVLSIYIFFARHHRDNFGLLAPRNTWCGNAWFGEQVSTKYGTWYSGPLCYLFELAFALVSLRFADYTVLTSPNKDETAVHGYGSTFIGSCRAGVSQSSFLRSITLAVMLYTQHGPTKGLLLLSVDGMVSASQGTQHEETKGLLLLPLDGMLSASQGSQHEATKGITTPPGWDTSTLQG